MDAQTMLTTIGDDFAFETFADGDVDRERRRKLRHEVATVAWIVHTIDPTPRQTLIFHGEK